MREEYHAELDQLGDGLVRMAELVELEMGRATAALLDVDLPLAERVIGDEVAVAPLHEDLDERALRLLALQQPVATDLRTIVASLRISADLERMGHLARHVAELARQRHPAPVVPVELRDIIARMSHVAARITTEAAEAIASRDPRVAVRVEREDDEMDQLHRSLSAALLRGDWPHGVEVGMDVALLGRYYERYADHAVSVARRIAFLSGQQARASTPAPVTHAAASGD
jgi:phosphate transport system protein